MSRLDSRRIGRLLPSPGVALLSVRSLFLHYGPVRALDGVSFEVATGECLALVGESGSGKTTVLRSINRMVVPDRGDIAVHGTAIAHQDPVLLRRTMGYVPQEGGLFPHWSVQRNAELVPRLLQRPDAASLGSAALEAVGLPPSQFGHRRPHELSGGQRQRVALARAIAAEPPVILLDEPFGALDAITRSDVQAAFASLQRQRRMTALLVTHDLAEACRLADHIAVMRAGRIEQLDAPATLLSSPATPYVAELLDRAGASTAWLPKP